MLKKLFISPEASLYQSLEHSNDFLSTYIFSSPESQAICNNPLVFGMEYTEKLKSACAKTFSKLKDLRLANFLEHQVVVLNILRGGLNFGLRDALHQSLGFNKHSSIFISAQRQQAKDNSWIITEDTYKKIDLHPINHLVFGDVVATGTSLFHGLDVVFNYAASKQLQISEVTFFTIGGPRTIEICEELFQKYHLTLKIKKINIVFLEGVFVVADKDTPYQIKIDGTDLIRLGATMAPEFIESQKENPLYPLERCTIYDAGSRAYNVPEYLQDVIEYWEQVEKIAEKTSLLQYVQERTDRQLFGTNIDLKSICQDHLKKLKKLL